MEQSVELSHIAHEADGEQELLTLNMGPHHPGDPRGAAPC
jgi:hypothetical protein